MWLQPSDFCTGVWQPGRDMSHDYIERRKADKHQGNSSSLVAALDAETLKTHRKNVQVLQLRLAVGKPCTIRIGISATGRQLFSSPEAPGDQRTLSACIFNEVVSHRSLHSGHQIKRTDGSEEVHRRR